MWKIGKIKVGASEYSYWAKVYDEGSRFGINGGRISKLTIKESGSIVCNYDRGWDVKPSNANARLALKQILDKEGN